MTSEYQWTPKNTLDHATTMAIVTAPMATANTVIVNPTSASTPTPR